jgi:hypothetical protein
MTARQVQALLSGDGALLLFALAEQESYAFALTRQGFDWKSIPLGAEALSLALLGPVEALAKNKRSLLVVPPGALTALPFHLLVTAKPVAAIPEKLEGYRDAA